MSHTGMYVLQGVVPTEIATAPFDVKVIDIYNDSGVKFTQSQVQQMGGGAGGGLLLGYFSIGEAETYRDYFSTIPKAAIGPENPQWNGNYEVAFWTPEWRAVATAYLDNVLSAGYDGIYFDVVDEYQTAWAKANAPGGAAGAEQAMADLVKYLADYAHAVNPDFKIWANNAEELLTNQTYFNAIDGMFKENLYYQDTGAKQPVYETQWSLGLLQPMLDAGKDVIAIEYVSTSIKVADVEAQAAHDGVGYYTADIDLNGVSYTGVLPGQVIHDDWSTTVTTDPVIVPTDPVIVPTDPVVTPTDPVITPTDPVVTPTDPVVTQPGVVLTGDGGDNALTGQAGNDELYGKGGDDVLSGNGGDDWLDGGRGNDHLTGGAGADTFVFRNGGANHVDAITDFQPGIDTIALSGSYFAQAGAPGELAQSAYWEGTAAHDANDHVIYNPATGVVYFDSDGTGSAHQVAIATVTPGTDLNYADFLVM